ncbi:PREDICTED: glycine-rich RNA-binding protein 2-like isoform X1 [Brassica oleracea var. oleracea]|nr:PREDICTED: glycine-rich RNA-binding protein 2-like isoform X1 [Brassica oleracea var. oleracea]
MFLSQLSHRVCYLASPLRCIATRGSCSSKLFVGVRVICDHMSGKSKGYGFVLFDSEEAAASALASMNNQLLEGRQIRVEYARPKGGLDQNKN